MEERTAKRMCSVLESIEKDLRVIASNSKAFDVPTKLSLDGETFAEIVSPIIQKTFVEKRNDGHGFGQG